ncbi:MAG: WecB/TagA/CpsF family glycosyltransferase [Muribaculaceae bacterium]|nr:WecB/TagA/CpsF family glycosyltransferase [Roseburia sp.]MCM1431840.1 WecB/TagA/CpsF family glycosyltransferase [Muribaculaceae bacterium]MCM1493521.1 WecB/TagA/CpsF family glycosyltransferase [Muribaculaceae bacterium]
MMKVIDVAGIQLDNCTVREAIMCLDREISDQGFHTIEEVNTDTLMLAATNDSVRAALTAMEHTVISEVAVLEAVGADSYQRRREVEHHDFFYELLRRIERNRKKLCLIGEESAKVQKMEEMLLARFPRCELISYALEDFEGKADSLVNEINVVTPDVILSILPSPLQEEFLLENKDRLSANLWYGIGSMNPEVQRRGILGMIQRLIRTRKLERQIDSFRQESVEDEQK